MAVMQEMGVLYACWPAAAAQLHSYVTEACIQGQWLVRRAGIQQPRHQGRRGLWASPFVVCCVVCADSSCLPTTSGGYEFAEEQLHRTHHAIVDRNAAFVQNMLAATSLALSLFCRRGMKGCLRCMHCNTASGLKYCPPPSYSVDCECMAPCVSARVCAQGPLERNKLPAAAQHSALMGCTADQPGDAGCTVPAAQCGAKVSAGPAAVCSGGMMCMLCEC